MNKVLIVNQNPAIDKTASVEKIKRDRITRFPRVLTLAGVLKKADVFNFSKKVLSQSLKRQSKA